MAVDTELSICVGSVLITRRVINLGEIPVHLPAYVNRGNDYCLITYADDDV